MGHITSQRRHKSALLRAKSQSLKSDKSPQRATTTSILYHIKNNSQQKSSQKYKKIQQNQQLSKICEKNIQEKKRLNFVSAHAFFNIKTRFKSLHIIYSEKQAAEKLLRASPSVGKRRKNSKF